MTQREKRKSEASRQCPKCGRFIGYAELEDGRAIVDYTPDTDFGPEQIVWEHVSCPGRKKK